MSDQVLSMNEPKRKLGKLEELLPNEPNDVLYIFGRFLAGYLADELFPIGFVVACETALDDLQKGVNSFTGRRISSQLAGHPPATYALLRMNIPRIVDAIFPAEFATEVKGILKEMKEMA